MFLLFTIPVTNALKTLLLFTFPMANVTKPMLWPESHGQSWKTTICSQIPIANDMKPMFASQLPVASVVKTMLLFSQIPRANGMTPMRLFTDYYSTRYETCVCLSYSDGQRYKTFCCFVHRLRWPKLSNQCCLLPIPTARVEHPALFQHFVHIPMADGVKPMLFCFHIFPMPTQ